MNEYEVTIIEDGRQRRETVMAASANAARDAIEERCDGDVTAVRFLRAVGFSCAVRDGRSGR